VWEPGSVRGTVRVGGGKGAVGRPWTGLNNENRSPTGSVGYLSRKKEKSMSRRGSMRRDGRMGPNTGERRRASS